MKYIFFRVFHYLGKVDYRGKVDYKVDLDYRVDSSIQITSKWIIFTSASFLQALRFYKRFVFTSASFLQVKALRFYKFGTYLSSLLQICSHFYKSFTN
jgi:hypothetical protein